MWTGNHPFWNTAWPLLDPHIWTYPSTKSYWGAWDSGPTSISLRHWILLLMGGQRCFTSTRWSYVRVMTVQRITEYPYQPCNKITLLQDNTFGSTPLSNKDICTLKNVSKLIHTYLSEKRRVVMFRNTFPMRDNWIIPLSLGDHG